MLSPIIGPDTQTTPIPSDALQSSVSKNVHEVMEVSWPVQTRLSKAKTSVGSGPYGDLSCHDVKPEYPSCRQTTSA